MTNAITTFTATAPVSYTLKSGKTKTAYTESAQARMPAATRLEAARAADLAQLKNNCFKPMLAQIDSLLSLAQKEVLVQMGAIPSSATKAACMNFFQQIANIFGKAKGTAQKDVAATLREFLDFRAEQDKNGTVPPAVQ